MPQGEPPTGRSENAAHAQLTVKELHRTVLKMLEVAALREGGGVPPGSSMEKTLDAALVRVNNTLVNLDLPLATAHSSSGHVAVSFKESDVQIVDAYESLAKLCKQQRAAIRHDRRDRSAPKSYSRRAFADGIKLCLRYVRAVTDDGAMKAAVDAERELRKLNGGESPSKVAGGIMRRYRLPGDRMAQSLKNLSSKAAVAKTRQQRGDEAIMREFLTCLQVPKEHVAGWAAEIGRARGYLGGNLVAVLPELKHPFQRRTLRLRRPTYSLRDACPPWKAPWESDDDDPGGSKPGDQKK